jgi:hypothetical protein
MLKNGYFCYASTLFLSKLPVKGLLDIVLLGMRFTPLIGDYLNDTSMSKQEVRFVEYIVVRIQQ